jgi:thioredoxin-like negative regulator of GroEL
MRIAFAGAVLLVAIAACEPSPPDHRRAADGLVADTSDTTFVRDVIDPGRPTVVYYWAHGCLPCIPAGAAVKRAARRYAGRVTFWKMNMGWSARRVRLDEVRGWPALVFYVGRREYGRRVGVPGGATDDSVAAFVDGALARAVGEARGALRAR